MPVNGKTWRDLQTTPFHQNGPRALNRSNPWTQSADATARCRQEGSGSTCRETPPGLAVMLGDTPFGTPVLTPRCATAPSHLASDRVAVRPAGRWGRSELHAR